MSTGPYAPPGSQPSDGEGAQKLSGAAEQAQEKAQELAGQAQQQAQQVAGQAKNRLREQLDERSSQAAGQITQQASDLRTVSASLREQGKDGPATAAGKLAEYGEKVGGYLNDRDSDRLLADLEDFGRRQPWAGVAGGLALGFAASRFLKASSSRRYSSRYGQETTPRETGASYAAPVGYAGQGPYVSPSGYPEQGSYPVERGYPGVGSNGSATDDPGATPSASVGEAAAGGSAAAVPPSGV